MKRYFRHFLDLRINEVIKFLTLSDLLVLSGWGIVNPILAVFFTDNIIGGSVVLAGFATTTYLITKSILQVPVARFIDIKKGEIDDFWFMIAGSLLTTLVAFMYIFIKYPWQVIASQVVAGIGAGLSFPAWQAIFTRHVDEQMESSEWSLYFTATDIGGAFAAALGGFMALHFGYPTIFIVVGLFSLAGTLFLAGAARKLRRS
jgi:DHA1 family quinolone resistance protein-like MFS transporter